MSVRQTDLDRQAVSGATFSSNSPFSTVSLHVRYYYVAYIHFLQASSFCLSDCLPIRLLHCLCMSPCACSSGWLSFCLFSFVTVSDSIKPGHMMDDMSAKQCTIILKDTIISKHLYHSLSISFLSLSFLS